MDGHKFIMKAREFKQMTGLNEGLALKSTQVITLITTIITCSILFYFLNKTKTGKSMRAYSNNQDLASFMIERRSELLLGLSNIIENAGEFAKENVFMKIAKIDNNIQLLIEDDGDGFSTEILHRLGDPYVTSRHKDDGLKDGLGLGFFISKTLFERLGIKMEIYNKNKPESGAVVSILIPKQGWV